MSTTEIVSDCQQIGTGALLIINNYILGLLWGSQCFFSLFDAHSKDEIGRMSATGTAVLLTFDSLQSLENYIKSAYYSNYPMTLEFQVQFLKIKCTKNAKSTIKNTLKSERKKRVSSLKKSPRKKKQGAKERNRDPESRRQYQNRKYQENPEQEKEYEKKKKKYQENPKP